MAYNEFAYFYDEFNGEADYDALYEQIRQELAATGDDGIQVIARHMNYGLYRVEGKSDCPRDALNICRMLSLKPEILDEAGNVAQAAVTLGIGNLLTGYLLTYDALKMEFRKVKLPSETSGCAICGTHPSITELIDYEQAECDGVGL